MEILTIIANYIPLIIVLIVLICGVITFFKDKKNLKNMLLYICTEAEKIYGSKTGQIKLAYAWGKACKIFPFLTKFLTFNIFSKMVDKCLVNFKNMVISNEKVAEYVGAEKKIEKGDE